MNNPSARALVVGSLNLDVLVELSRVPAAGETLQSLGSALGCGGKGGNQAVACARMGLEVSMIGRVGKDPIGTMLREGLAADGIDIRAVADTEQSPTGTAVVMLTPDGENRIVVCAGANGELSADDLLPHAQLFADAAILVCQLEVPVATVSEAMRRARGHGVAVLLNPAPAQPLSDAMLQAVDYLVVNQTEASLLAQDEVIGIASAARTARALRARGAQAVLVTLGALGVLVADRDGERHLPAPVVRSIDSTAAGDTFIGGLAAGLCERKSLDDSTRLGIHAAALSVGRRGAQASIPTREEVERMLIASR